MGTCSKAGKTAGIKPLKKEKSDATAINRYRPKSKLPLLGKTLDINRKITCELIDYFCTLRTASLKGTNQDMLLI